jgi:2-hydroxychromene-2-carboxylate isomerase
MPINTWPAHWPTDVKPASLAVLAAQELDADPGLLSFALLRALWAEERNIADAGTIHAVVEEAMPADAATSILTMMSDPAISTTYDTFSNEAIAAGVFGAPTYIVGDEMFFGQDRLDFVAQALGVAE